MSIDWEYFFNCCDWEMYGLYDTNSDGTWDKLTNAETFIWHYGYSGYLNSRPAPADSDEFRSFIAELERETDEKGNPIEFLEPRPAPADGPDYRFYIDLLDTDFDGTFDRYVHGLDQTVAIEWEDNRWSFAEDQSAVEDYVFYNEDISELNLAVPERVGGVDHDENAFNEHYAGATGGVGGVISDLLQDVQYDQVLNLRLGEDNIDWTHLWVTRDLTSTGTSAAPLRYSFGLTGDGEKWQKAYLILRDDADGVSSMHITWNIERWDFRQAKPYRPEIGVQENPYKTNDGNDVANFEFVHLESWRAMVTTPSRIKLGTRLNKESVTIEDTDLDGTWDTYTTAWRPPLPGGYYGQQVHFDKDISHLGVVVEELEFIDGYDQGVLDGLRWLPPLSVGGEFTDGSFHSSVQQGNYPIDNFAERGSGNSYPWQDAFGLSADYFNTVLTAVNEALPPQGAHLVGEIEVEPGVLDIEIGSRVGEADILWSDHDMVFLADKVEIDATAPLSEVEAAIDQIHGYIVDPDISN